MSKIQGNTYDAPPDDRLPHPRGRRKKASMKLLPHRLLPPLSVRRVCQPI